MPAHARPSAWVVAAGRLQGPAPSLLDDVTTARRGSGREPLIESDRLQPGPCARRFPLFG